MATATIARPPARTARRGVGAGDRASLSVREWPDEYPDADLRMLLAYLATGKITFGQWIRFVFPLAAVLFALCAAALSIGVAIGL